MLQALSAARTALSRNGALHAAIADVLRLILLWLQSTVCLTCRHTNTIMLFLYSPSSATLCSVLMLRFLSQGADTKWDARWTGPRTWEMMDSTLAKRVVVRLEFQSYRQPILLLLVHTPKNLSIMVRINYYHSFVWCFWVFFRQVVTLMKHGYTVLYHWFGSFRLAHTCLCAATITNVLVASAKPLRIELSCFDLFWRCLVCSWLILGTSALIPVTEKKNVVHSIVTQSTKPSSIQHVWAQNSKYL